MSNYVTGKASPTLNNATAAKLFPTFLRQEKNLTASAKSSKKAACDANFMQNWLDKVVELNVQATSLQAYISCCKRHIYPQLSEEKIQDLTPAKLDAWIRGLHSDKFTP